MIYKVKIGKRLITISALFLVFLVSNIVAKNSLESAGQSSPIAEIRPTVVNVLLPSNQLASVEEESLNKGSFTPQINWDALSNGGSIDGSSADYILSGTINQSAAGIGYVNSLSLQAGFWQDFASLNGSCCDVAGDANGDATSNIGDAVFLISFIFRGGVAPDCLDEGDSNGDCSINVADAVYLIFYNFHENPPPICGCANKGF